MTDQKYPKTEKEWEEFKLELRRQGDRQLDKGCLIAAVILLIVVLGWFFWMMWISTGGSY